MGRGKELHKNTDIPELLSTFLGTCMLMEKQYNLHVAYFTQA